MRVTGNSNDCTGCNKFGVHELLRWRDDAQRIIGTASAPLTARRPHPGWSEQDPQTWLDAVFATFGALRAAHPAAFASVRSIGLSGQMHGATLLDANDRPLRPCILWNDDRAAAECSELEVAVPLSRSITGNLAMPGFTAPKLAWVAKHEPAGFAATRRVLLPKAYVRRALTGEAIDDMSDAAGTLWLDVAKRIRWRTAGPAPAVGGQFPVPRLAV